MTDQPLGRRMQLTGLHHVTLICAELERTTAFYRDVLGLALVRQGASDDDPDARHFWFGNAAGEAGTLVTFLEYPQLEEGRVGRDSIHHLALAVDTVEELAAWRDYLRHHGHDCTDVMDRGAFSSLYLRDPDGHILEIASRMH